MQDNFNIHNWKLDKAVEALNIEESATFTDKYNDNPELKGDQKDLPDEIQAKIVAKENLDINQTQVLSKEVAKGLVLALKAENAELTSLEVKNLEPNSFEIYVVYKDGADDEFVFHVDGNELKLSDFTFTEVLATVDENGNVDKNEIKDNLLKTWDKHIKKNKELEEDIIPSYSDNPEGDKLVLRFLQGIAKKYDYPVSHAAMFVKERIKKLGY